MSRHAESITIPLRTDLGLPRGETLWAERVDHDTFRLLNCSFYLPLAVGDLVLTHRSGGRHVVVGLKEPGEMTLSVTDVESSVSADELRSVTDAWRPLGARWTEGAPGVLVTVWSADADADAVFAAITETIAGRAGWSVPAVYAPCDRRGDPGRLWQTLTLGVTRS